MNGPSSSLYAMAFVDGQNLFQHAKDAFGHYHPNYDLVRLHQAVCVQNGWSPTLVRFYSGIPDQNFDPMWAGYWNSRILAMKHAGIHVTTRKLRYRERTVIGESGEEEVLWVPQEKGIDVRLALDLVKLARQRQYNVAVLYSQDQDLAEVVAEVKEIAAEQKRRIEICCAFPSGSSASYKRGVNGTQWFQIEETLYNTCLDPRDYRPARFR